MNSNFFLILKILLDFFFLIYRKRGGIPIYTCSSSIQKPIKWKDFFEMNRRHAGNWPSIYSIWYHSFSFTRSAFKHSLKRIVCHIVPGYILDTLASWSGRTPVLVIILLLDK